MIRKLTSVDAYKAFIDDLNADPAFCDPMLSTNEQCINVSNFANGLYLVRVVFKNGESSTQNLLISK